MARLKRLATTKPCGWKTLVRTMTPDEFSDYRRGWPASALRRRATTGLGLRVVDVEAEAPEAEAA